MLVFWLFQSSCNNLFIFMFQLEPYMTEKFLLQSFELMGEQPRTINVMRKNGLPAGYGFCQFQDKKQATEALHKLNGKIIPNSQPVWSSFFKLPYFSISCHLGYIVGNLFSAKPFQVKSQHKRQRVYSCSQSETGRVECRCWWIRSQQPASSASRRSLFNISRPEGWNPKTHCWYVDHATIIGCMQMYGWRMHSCGIRSENKLFEIELSLLSHIMHHFTELGIIILSIENV